MSDVFVVEALRTPFGSFGGMLKDIEAPKLAAMVIKELLNRTKLKGEDIDEIIMGEVLQGGVGQAPARQAMLLAGLPPKVHAMTINKVCGSSLKAVMLGANSIQLGDSNIVIAGGAENMSKAPYYLKNARFGYRMGDGSLIDGMIYDGLLDPYDNIHMGVITEEIAKQFSITRQAQDEYAIRSYKLAQKAIENGTLKDEIIPVIVKDKKGDIVIEKDEDPYKVVFEKIPELKPVFLKDGTITAANASTISDGAAFCILASKEAVEKYHLKPLARLVSYATNSLTPKEFPIAPIGAIKKAVERANLTLKDIDFFEINEAFAAVVIAAINELKLDINKVNVNGGAIAIGHPIGASGGRLVATLIKQMKRANAKYGLATLCIGGGEAVAAIFENV